MTFEEMSPAEQILYVQDLWDRIAADPERVPVPDDLKAELDRRLAAHRADPGSAIPWSQVKAELGRRP
ncbi:MAG: addiction module protein [Nannocystaceae bacterium]